MHFCITTYTDIEEISFSEVEKARVIVLQPANMRA